MRLAPEENDRGMTGLRMSARLGNAVSVKLLTTRVAGIPRGKRSGDRSGDHSGAHRVAHHVGEGMQVELVHETLAVGIHRARTDVHDPADFLAASPLCN